MASGTMPDESFNEEILEESEYSRKSEFSKPTLIQTQVGKCFDLRSRDMKPGFTTFVQGKPEVIPDSRKEYVGAVEVLKNGLSPELDIHMPELNDMWDAAKLEAFNKFAYSERIGRVWKDDKAVWVYSGRIFMPQKGSEIMCNNEKTLSTGFIYAPKWDANVDAYWDLLVEYSDELFQELNRLIHKLDYFKGGTSM